MLFGRTRRFRGQGLVEFALVGPIFFLLVLGIIEGGRLVWTYHSLNNAVKEGSRYALVRGTNSELSDAPVTNASVEAYMESKSAALNPANFDASITLPDGNMDNQSRLQINATYEMDFIVSYIFGMGSIELSASSQAIFAR